MSPTQKLKHLISIKESMNPTQKKKLLGTLKLIREEYTGNLGGETDITNADNLTTNEGNEGENVIAKTFDTKSDFDSYVNQHRGIEMTAKEQQAVLGYKKSKPTQQDKFFVKYENADTFSNNSTTIIKKLKEGNQFCWTAFATYENAEEKGEELSEANPPQVMPSVKNDAEVTADDPIRITKSITFTDDTNGANILSKFLMKLDI